MNKKEINENEITASTLFVGTNEKKVLTVSSSATVQPVALMRLGVFVPKPGRKKGMLAENIDASNDLSKLELARAEGYDNVIIRGERLDMEIDFKVWVGIIHSFSKYGLNTNTITVPYLTFAKMCGFSSERLGKKLKEDIRNSLTKIRNKGITFTKKNNAGSSYITGLLKTGYLDFDNNIISLEADPKLWELYQFDNRVLLQLNIIKQLQQKETAQALYTFIEALPQTPAPLSFTRIRNRLALKSEKKEQNRSIKKAINHLQKMGYLDGSVKKKDGEDHLYIYERNKKLFTHI